MIDEIPLNRNANPPPGAPDEDVILTPGIFPYKAPSTVPWLVLPTSSSLETVATALAKFLLLTVVPRPVITTSSKIVSSVFITIVMKSALAGTDSVSNPIKENVKLSPSEASIVKLPSKSDVVPIEVPSTTTVTPGIGFESSSWILPLICCE